MGRLASYVRPFYGYIAFTMLIKLLGAVAELFIPYFMELVLGVGIESGKAPLIVLYGSAMLVAAFLCLALNILANRMTAKSSGQITLRLRHDLYEKLNSLSSAQMDALTLPSAEARLTSDTYHINQFLARGQRMGVRAPILLLGGLVMMLLMDARLALVAVALLPLICLVVILVTKKSVPLHRREQEELDRMVQVVQENTAGVRVVRAFAAAETERTRFACVNDDLSDINIKAGSLTSVSQPATTLILNVGLSLVVLVGAQLVNMDLSQPSVIVAFLQYFVMILNAMLGITRVFTMAARGQAAALRVAEVLELPEDLTVRPPELGKQGSGAHVEFSHVSFSYTGVGQTLSDISFSLGRGQTLGILGPTGAGKSTVLSLLLRLYDADSGRVMIDGQDIRTVPREELTRKFGVVFQHDFVAAGTLREAISFFREIPEADILKAAAVAHAAEYIERREGGYDGAVVSRGNDISGGQRQRLLISRALAGNPEILLLDDASSALDYATDAAFRRALSEEYPDVTKLIVAQRVSSIAHADAILVLDGGRTVGYGTHDELMRTCPLYRTVADIQMQATEGGAP